MKENFDDIIRRRWEQQTFPVDNSHHQDMARLLEGNKKRRGFIFWWFGAAALIIMAGTFLYLKQSGNVEQPTTITSTTNEMANLESENKNEDLTKSSDESTPTSTKEDNKLTISTSENLKARSSQNTNSNKESIQKEKSTSNNDLKKNETSIPSSKSNPGNTKLAMTAAQAELDKNEKTQNENEAPPSEGYKVELENPNQATIASNEAAIRVFPDSIEYDPWTNAIYRDGTVRSLNITKPVDALAVSEVSSNSDNGPHNITPHTKMTHPLYLIGETGLGLVLASKPYYDGGIKFNVGGGLGLRMMPRVHLQLTGGYLLQDGGFHFEKTSTVNSLSFGVRSQSNTLRPDRLHFIYGKLGSVYRFNRSTIDSHIGVQWLYGSQGNITTQVQNQVPPGNSESTTYAWLNTEGLRKTQWWWDVSYGYRLFPQFYVHGGASWYFTSLTESNEDAQESGYYWKGQTAKVQPFITLNYLFNANF